MDVMELVVTLALHSLTRPTLHFIPLQSRFTRCNCTTKPLKPCGMQHISSAQIRWCTMNNFFFAQNTSNAMHRTHSPEGTGRYQIRWMEGREGIVVVGQEEEVGGVTRGTIFMHSAHRPVLHLPPRLNLTNSEILRSTSREI